MQRPSFGEAFSLRRTIAHALIGVRLAPGPMWLGGFLMLIGDGCNPLQLNDFMPSDDKRESLRALPHAAEVGLAAAGRFGLDLSEGLSGAVLGTVLAMVLLGTLVALAVFALGCWATTGFTRMHVAILERQDKTLGPLFSGRDRFWAMAGYRGLAGLSLSAAMLVSGWPGAMLALYGYIVERPTWMFAGGGLAVLLMLPALGYVALGTFLGEHAVALDGMQALPALRRSWQLASGNRWRMLWFALACGVLQVVSIVGILLCCVGALATMPLTRALIGFAKTEGYLLFTRGPGEAAKWTPWARDASS